MDYTTMGILDLWGLWRSGKITEAFELWEAIKTRDIANIADELGDIAELFGLKGADLQLNELAAAIKNVDFKNIKSMTKVNRELLDVVDLVADKFAPQPVITTMAKKHIDDYTRAEAVQWLADSRSLVRGAADLPSVKFLFRDEHEILAMLRGEAVPTAMDPEKLERIIEACRFGAKWCLRLAIIPTPASPYLYAVGWALTFIVHRYDRNHPKGAEGAGLEFSDFLTAA